MSVKVNSKTPEVIDRVQNQASLSVRLFIEEAHKTSNDITPMKTGELRKRVLKSISGTSGEIEWKSNYASFQENPLKKFNYTTPGTGPHFAEKSIKRTVEKLPEIIREVGE